VQPHDVVEPIELSLALLFDRPCVRRARPSMSKRSSPLDCGVPAFAAAAHTSCDVLAFEQLLEFVAAVPDCLVRVPHRVENSTGADRADRIRA
jgi:hypothetical protein